MEILNAVYSFFNIPLNINRSFLQRLHKKQSPETICLLLRALASVELDGAKRIRGPEAVGRLVDRYEFGGFGIDVSVEDLTSELGPRKREAPASFQLQTTSSPKKQKKRHKKKSTIRKSKGVKRKVSTQTVTIDRSLSDYGVERLGVVRWMSWKHDTKLEALTSATLMIFSPDRTLKSHLLYHKPQRDAFINFCRHTLSDVGTAVVFGTQDEIHGLKLSFGNDAEGSRMEV